jgi:hypothetical protein
MATEPPKPNIDVGRVLSRAFEAIKANALPFFGLALLLVGLPAFAGQYYMITRFESQTAFLNSPDRAELRDFNFLLSPAFWAPVAAVLLASLIGYLLLQVMVTRSTILQLGRRQPDIAGSFTLALWLALPAFGLTICVFFLLMIGFILLFFPALMIWCALIVALPVLVQERAGIFRAMARSRALTRGSRWRIFLLVILIWILSMMVSGVTGAIGATTTSFDGTSVIQNPIVSGLASALGSTVTGLVTTVLVAALYVELREVKEGAATADLATVFD